MSSVAAVSTSSTHVAQPASNGAAARRGRKKKQQPPQQQHDANSLAPAASTDNTTFPSSSASSPHAPFITPPRPARSPPPPASAPTAAPNNNNNKPDLAHLVGRPLVPFFLDNGSENTSQQPAASVSSANDGRQWAVCEDGKGVAVRQFVDGYFVDVGTIGGQQHDGKGQATPRTAPAKGGGKGGKGKGKAAAGPTPITTAPGASAVSYSAAVQQGAPAAKRTLHPAPSPPAPSSPLPSGPSAKYGAPAFTNSPSPMKVPLPKFLKDKTAAGSIGPVPTVPAISEEMGGYVRGPSLMHLLQQQAEEEEEAEGSEREAESATNGQGSFTPISLMHLLQPQPQPDGSAAHDASLLHSATFVPVSSFSPSFIPPHAATSTTAHLTATSSPSDVPLSMPKLLFLRQSSIDETNTVVTTVPLDSPSTITPSPATATTPSTHSPTASFHHPTVNDAYLPPTSFPLHNGAAAASYPLPSPLHSLPIYNTSASASSTAVVSAPSAC